MTNSIEPVLLSMVEKGSVIKFIENKCIIDYNVVIRTKLTDGELPAQQCDNFIAKFSAVTNSKWIVKHTAPHAVRIVYKKCYACKHKNCNAKIIIILKKNNRNTRKNDPLLAKGLTAVIKIKFKHSHDVFCPARDWSNVIKAEQKFDKEENSSDDNFEDSSSNSPEFMKLEDENHENIGLSPILQCKSPDLNNINTANGQTNGTNNLAWNSCSKSNKTEDLSCSKIKQTEEIAKFNFELNRILKMVEELKSDEMIKLVESVNKKLKRITTSQQLCDFFKTVID